MSLHSPTSGTVAAEEATWRPAYMLGAMMACVVLAATVLDIVLTMVPALDASTVPATAEGWLAQLGSQPWLGLRNLDLLNAALALVGLPLYFAISGAHRHARPATAMLAFIFAAAGALLFAGNNIALPMLQLAREHAHAAPDACVGLEAAASALLARGAHGSFGALPGFLVSEIGTLLTAVLMVRGRVFGRATGWIGIVGTGALMVYTVAITVTPGSEALMKGLAAPAGLLMLAWYALSARALWRLEA